MSVVESFINWFESRFEDASNYAYQIRKASDDVHSQESYLARYTRTDKELKKLQELKKISDGLKPLTTEQKEVIGQGPIIHLSNRTIEKAIKDWEKDGHKLPNPYNTSKKIAREKFAQAIFKAIYNQTKPERQWELSKDIYETGKFIKSAWTEFVMTSKPLYIPPDPTHKKLIDQKIKEILKPKAVHNYYTKIPWNHFIDYPDLSKDWDDNYVLKPGDTFKKTQKDWDGLDSCFYKVLKTQKTKLNAGYYSGDIASEWQQFCLKDNGTYFDPEEIEKISHTNSPFLRSHTYRIPTSEYDQALKELDARKKAYQDIWDYARKDPNFKGINQDKVFWNYVKIQANRILSGKKLDPSEFPDEIRLKPKKSNKMSKPQKIKIGDQEFDCDDLVAEERERLAKKRASAKKSAKTPESKKNTKRLDKTTDTIKDNIKERIDDGTKPSKREIVALISKARDLKAKLVKLKEQL